MEHSPEFQEVVVGHHAQNEQYDKHSQTSDNNVNKQAPPFVAWTSQRWPLQHSLCADPYGTKLPNMFCTKPAEMTAVQGWESAGRQAGTQAEQQSA
jgi:hypothetical protein